MNTENFPVKGFGDASSAPAEADRLTARLRVFAKNTHDRLAGRGLGEAAELFAAMIDRMLHAEAEILHLKSALDELRTGEVPE